MFRLFSIHKRFVLRKKYAHTPGHVVRSTVLLFGTIPLFYYDVDNN